VSGVVAASLGVVLISVLLSMVVTFWVPAWGYDNELAHSREVLNSFGQFKNAVELQALASNTNQTVTTTFPLGVGAVPLFGAETPGALSFQYLEGGNVRFRANLTDGQGQVNLSAAGSLEHTVLNRYYVPQTMAYESGAVVIDQRGVSIMRLPAPLGIVNGTQGLEVSVSLVSLEGTQRIVTGVDSHVVSSRLTVTYTQVFTWSPLNNLTFSVISSFDEAWARFFNETANSSGLDASRYNVSSLVSQDPYSVALRLYNVRTLTVTVSLVNVRVD
jgi:hypothetical protein